MVVDIFIPRSSIGQSNERWEDFEEGGNQVKQDAWSRFLLFIVETILLEYVYKSISSEDIFYGLYIVP